MKREESSTSNSNEPPKKKCVVSRSMYCTVLCLLSNTSTRSPQSSRCPSLPHMPSEAHQMQWYVSVEQTLYTQRLPDIVLVPLDLLRRNCTQVNSQFVQVVLLTNVPVSVLEGQQAAVEVNKLTLYTYVQVNGTWRRTSASEHGHYALQTLVVGILGTDFN